MKLPPCRVNTLPPSRSAGAWPAAALVLLGAVVGVSSPAAWAQLGAGAPAPPGLVEVGKLQALQTQLNEANGRVNALQQQVQQLKTQAATQPNPATQAQISAAQREAQQARERVATLQAQLTQAVQERDQARKAQASAEAAAQAAAKPAATAAEETRRLRSQLTDAQAATTQAQKERDAFKAQLAATQAEWERYRRAAAMTASTPAATASTTATSATTASLVPSAPRPFPADLTPLTVPGCGSACPVFVLMPNPGPVTLGRGAEALRVDLKHRYAMGQTEVTVGQWKAFWNTPDRNYQPQKTENTHCNWDDKDYAQDDRKPVVCVNTLDAEAYARWFTQRHTAALGQAAGVRVQAVALPTEVEFEFAARGGRYTEDYLWADNASKDEICRHAQVGVCPGGTLPVASRLKNGYQLFDMIGNTWKWQASPWRDARSALPANGLEPMPAWVWESRAVRGASFNDVVVRLRLASRDGYSPGYRGNGVGFRVVARIASE